MKRPINLVTGFSVANLPKQICTELDLVAAEKILLKNVEHASTLFMEGEGRERLIDYISFFKTYDPLGDFRWHISRLAGYGGSDIGPIVGSLIADQDPVESEALLDGFMVNANSVQRSKLCYQPKDVPADFLDNGNRVEPISKYLFKQWFDLEYGSFDDVTDCLDEWNSDLRNRPDGLKWLVGKPDLILKCKGLYYVIDVKNDAANNHLNRLTPPRRYTYQTHHYSNILERSGAPVADTNIIAWTFVNSDQHRSIHPVAIPLDRSIYRVIEHCGSMAWSKRLSQNPYLPMSSRALVDVESLTVDQREHFKDVSARFVAAKSYSSALSKTAEIYQDRLKDMIGGMRIEGKTTFTFPNILNVSAQIDIEEEKIPELLDLLASKQMIPSPKDLIKEQESPAIDPIKAVNYVKASVEAYATQHGIDSKDLLAEFSKIEYDIDSIQSAVVRLKREDPEVILPGVKIATRFTQPKAGYGKAITETSLAQVEESLLTSDLVDNLKKKSDLKIVVDGIPEATEKLEKACFEDIKNLFLDEPKDKKKAPSKKKAELTS